MTKLYLLSDSVAGDDGVVTVASNGRKHRVPLPPKMFISCQVFLGLYSWKDIRRLMSHHGVKPGGKQVECAERLLEHFVRNNMAIEKTVQPEPEPELEWKRQPPQPRLELEPEPELKPEPRPVGKLPASGHRLCRRASRVTLDVDVSVGPKRKPSPSSAPGQLASTKESGPGPDLSSRDDEPILSGAGEGIVRLRGKYCK